jgi:hypothetical protein
VTFFQLDGATCQFLSSNSTSNCYPMIGSMTAKFLGDSSASGTTAVKNYLLGVIQTQMNDNLVLSGAVEKAMFLGNRSHLKAPTQLAKGPALPQESTPIVSTTESTSAAPSTVIIASSLSTVAAAVVILVLFALFLSSRRNNRSNATRKVGNISEVDELEHVETGSSQHSSDYIDDDSRASLPSPINNVPLTLPELLADTLADRSMQTDGTVGSGEAATVLSGGEMTVASCGDVTIVSASSDVSDKAIGENMEAYGNSMSDDKALELPPKPPQGPSKQPPPVQQTLAKRRRRRKKKKVKNPAIPRVGSRENINAMETISEAHGEGAENDSDDEDCSDSEYSYETDESGSRSRDPSPCRGDGGSGEFLAPTV